MVSEDAYIGKYRDDGGLPVRSSAFEKIIENVSGDAADWMTVLNTQMQHINLKPGDAIYDYIQDEYTAALQAVMMGDTTPETAVQNAYDNVITRATDAGIIK